jgi:death on curing protein
MIRYIGLAENLWLAEQVTGIDAPVLAKPSRLDLADSALHAPAAGSVIRSSIPTSSTKQRC